MFLRTIVSVHRIEPGEQFFLMVVVRHLLQTATTDRRNTIVFSLSLSLFSVFVQSNPDRRHIRRTTLRALGDARTVIENSYRSPIYTLFDNDDAFTPRER